MNMHEDLYALSYLDMDMSASLRRHYTRWNEYNAQLDEAIQRGDPEDIRKVRDLIKDVKRKIRARGGNV